VNAEEAQMAQGDTRALVAHLFRRAGFGLRPDELDHFTRLGVPGCVDYLIDYDKVAVPADLPEAPPNLAATAARLARIEVEEDTSVSANRAAVQSAQSAGFAQIKLLLQTWWINRMLHTTRPLEEKMTLFWHGHFATAGVEFLPMQMVTQNQLFRHEALGNFHTLLGAVTQDAAMLHWLNGDLNHKGSPNENLARELMELFTLGHGYYTETDVREGARALTGWKFKHGTYDPIWVPALHDNGVKTYLGHTGNLGPADVVTILAAHPATGPFLARKLYSFFAYDNPSDDVVQPVAETYYRSGYSIKAMMRQLLLSDDFYSEQAFQEHLKSPPEFVVGTVRELGVPMPVADLAQAMAAMGQDLFNPPNVGGWPGGVQWASANGLVVRYNFAGAIGAQVAPRDLVRQAAARDAAGLVGYLLDRLVAIEPVDSTRAALIAYLGGGKLASPDLDTRVRGLVQLVLATPEYQF
jgi:uncharacterized protein (DUF1800 family)